MILTHFGTEVDLTRTYDQQDEYKRIDKPRGLWLSDESDFGWSEWCKDAGFRDTDAQIRTDFRVRESAVIITLSTPEEIVQFGKAYGLEADRNWMLRDTVYGIDWPAVAKVYDGIVITPYQWSCRLDMGWYSSWDVASACIWNLAVLEVIELVHPKLG